MASPESEGSAGSRDGCWERFQGAFARPVLAVQRRLQRATGAVGALAARKPVWVLVLSLLAAIAASCGWLRFRVETAGDILWVPQESAAKSDEHWLDRTYGSGGGYAQVLITVKPRAGYLYGKNALQLGVFFEMFQMDAAIKAIKVDHGGATYGWEQVCDLNFNGTCKHGGPLFLWENDFNAYLAWVSGSAANATAGDRDALIAAVNSPQFPDQSSVPTLSIFGGIVLSPLANPAPGQPPLYMSSAEVVTIDYVLRGDLPSKAEKKWYKDFLDLLEKMNTQVAYTDIAYIAGSSVDDEIGRSVTNDLYLIVISVAIFVFVAVIGMSRRHAVATRSSLALLGVVAAILAMMAGYGLSMLFGCAFTTLSQTLPYILLGLSIDCMFILTKAYDSAVALDPSASLEARFRHLMSTAGTSVVVTLLSSCVAFALGSISELPSIRWFSVYATMSVFCIAVATLTFFAACFVLTERRIARNRVDCLCCMTSGAPLVPTAARTMYEAQDSSGGGGGGSSSGRLSNTSDTDRVPTAIVIPMIPPSRSGPVAESSTVEQQPPSPPPHAANTTTLSVASTTSYNVGADTDKDPKKSAVPYVANGAGAGSLGREQQQQQLSGDGAAPLAASDAEPNFMKRMFERFYAPFLTKWWGKTIVILVFIGWAVLTGIGIPKLKEGQPLSELAPDDSYLQDYVRVMKDTFQQQIGSPTELYFRNINASDPVEQGKMLRALAMSLDAEYINATISAFQGNWLLDFIGWVQTAHTEVALVALPDCVNPFVGRTSGDLGLFADPHPIGGCVPAGTFFPLLTEFLQQRKGYLDDVRLTLSASGAVTGVSSSRFPLIHIAEAERNAYGRLLIKDVRKLEDRINNHVFWEENYNAQENVVFVFNSNYIYNEGDAILAPMTIEYVLLAVAGVGLVLLLTLPSLRAVLLMMFAVGLVDYFIFGEMFILDIRFNQVSIINLIMATGLAVDYSVYFAQAFVATTADGTRNGRMAAALTDTGSAVFVGGLTALMGTIPLAFSTSTILRTFFALIFGTIAFALLIGLMLMPVIFSLIGPPPPRPQKGAAPVPGPAAAETLSSRASSKQLGSKQQAAEDAV